MARFFGLNRLLFSVVVFAFVTASAEAGSVVLVGSDTVNAFTNRIQGMYNRVANGATQVGTPYSAIGVYNTNQVNPTLSQLQQYDTALVWAATSQFDAVALGNTLADYVDGGGNVVMMMNFGLFAPGGRWATGGYDPLISTGYTLSGQSIDPTFNPANPLLAGVTTLNAEYKMIGTARDGAVVHASFLAGSASVTPLLVETTAFNGRVRNLNFYAAEPLFPNTNGDIDRLIYNAINVGMAPAPVPEPSSILIYSLGAACLWARRKK